ncbi:hypothetical protein PMIN06_008839 [Paraphaeosphaeria minitans]
MVVGGWWFPIPDKTYNANGKAWASWNVFQSSQMIVMGGEKLNPDNVQNCDSRNTGEQHGLLPGQEGTELNIQWHGLMLNVSSYRVPSNITEIIGGGTHGKATVTKPLTRATSDLSIYFKNKLSRTGAFPHKSDTYLRYLLTANL